MGIIGSVGLIGSGKTYTQVRRGLIMAERRNAVFVSNIWTRGSVAYADLGGEVADRVQLSTGEDGFSLDELQAVRDASKEAGRGLVFFVDEIGVLMPARMWQRFPVNLMQEISQSRKYRMDLLFTAQDPDDVDSYLRKKTAVWYKVYSFPRGSIERQERGKRPIGFYESEWGPNQVGKKDKRRGRSWTWYSRKWEREYDTDELVLPAKRVVAADLCASHKREVAQAACPLCLSGIEVGTGLSSGNGVAVLDHSGSERGGWE